ncbi:hypothetical protein C8N32_11436 [Rhodovulum imhoffii]|uniref:AEC family transporter n=1 Tax=Rhodovulum imhoffii TaxID=365340 RepID=A0A2T5BQC6_9RHOB|nr:AEC family transporter [Rhodovulum imhoffii]MBK5933684.1 hypothetical protein [Rhodovulum imhoffii]PTN01337.1 hypothetical protein C8N32_11436 [Rhodovulum imhoffii]
MTVGLLVLPIILTITVGYLAKRFGAVPRDNWTGIEQLSFKVLIPAIIIQSIYQSDLALSQLGEFIWALLITVSITGILVLASRLVIPHSALGNPQLTTIFQATTRWNAFIALALSSQALGQPGLALISIAMAFIIPFVNVLNIVVLATYGDTPINVRKTVQNIVTNPLILACAIGLFLNFSGVSLASSAESTLKTIGQAAIGIGLLAIGASIDFRKLIAVSWPLAFGTVARLVVGPAIFWLIGQAFGLDNTQMLCGMLICAVPAASNGYIVAKQMGGDADLYAHLLMWQTILAIFTLPIMIVLAS